MNKQPLEKVLNIYKERAVTPFQALEQLRETFPEYKNTTLSYAGRLDPMAEGVLVVLVGEENKNREKYLGLDKEYSVDVLFGIETDTYDTLGLITNMKTITTTSSNFLEEKLKNILKRYQTTFLQEYPGYSSKPVNGKPLFEWAREGKLHEVIIPKKLVTIFDIALQTHREVSAEELLSYIEKDIKNVIGDFRQQESLKSWRKRLKKPDELFTLATITIKCSSGTYARSLAHRIGKDLGTSAIAYRIIRTQVGIFSSKDSIKYL